MSHRLFNVVKEKSSAKGSARMMLLFLADCHNDKTGQCNPAIETLAEWCNVTVRNAHNLIQSLVDDKEIEVIKGGGRGNRSAFRITLLQTRNSEETFTEETFTEKLNSEISGSETVKNSVVNSEKPGCVLKEEPKEPNRTEDSSVAVATSPVLEVPVVVSETPTPQEPIVTEENPVKVVFEYWKSVMGKAKASLDSKRETKIKLRLKDFSVEEIKIAIDGCRASAYHMGQNDSKTKYNDIELICRDAAHFERFLENGHAKKPKTNVSQFPGQPREPRVIVAAAPVDWAEERRRALAGTTGKAVGQ